VHGLQLQGFVQFSEVDQANHVNHFGFGLTYENIQEKKI
jgi:hypothetical protein